MRRRQTVEQVKGHSLPAPHITRAGKWALFRTVALPSLALLLALDILLGALFHFGLGACYGLMCLLP